LLELASKAAAIALLGLGLLVGALTVRLLHQARAHLEAGLAAVASGDIDIARIELEDAAKAYVPASPYPARALAELAILARTAEMRGDVGQALFTWEVLRRSVLATRHLVIPNPKALEEAEAEIVRLRRTTGMEGAQASAAVARPVDPSTPLTLLLVLSFGAWVLGAAALCAGAGKKDGLVLAHLPGARRLALGLSLAGLALWLVLSIFV
jgi:hypothetical protein